MVTDFTEPYSLDNRFGNHSVLVEQRKVFADWLTLAPDKRVPRSMKALAEELGVGYATLKLWKNDVRFITEVAGRLGRHIDIEYVPGIIRTLHKQATDVDNPRSVQAAKELLGYLRWNIERSESLNSPDIRQLSDEELQTLLVDALNVLDQRK